MTQAQQIKEYNAKYYGYNITGIKKCSIEELNWARKHNAKTLDELYNSYSDAKLTSYNDILETYEPLEIIGLQGNSMSYSITLVANNGDILWITKSNNYLVEVRE